MLVINLTDFVVKPSQASYEAARAIGEPVRRAREQEILSDIEADLRRPCRPRASTPCAIQAGDQGDAGAPDRRPADHRGHVLDADKGVIAQRRGARCRRAWRIRSRPRSSSGRRSTRRGPSQIQIAGRRLLRHAALRRRAAVPGDRPRGRPPGGRLHQEHRVRRARSTRRSRSAHAAQPAHHLRGLRRHRAS